MKYLNSLKQAFLVGLVAILPISVTIWVGVKFFQFIDEVMAPQIQVLIGFHVPGMGVIASLVLITLAGLLTRMIRSSLGEELHRGYLQTARAKGLGRLWAVVRHAFRNASSPVVTIVGLQFGTLLTGAIITETIFAWPGLGRLLIQAIHLRDYPLVQGGVLAIALSYVLVNLLTDLLYGVIDPRIRYEGIRE